MGFHLQLFLVLLFVVGETRFFHLSSLLWTFPTIYYTVDRSCVVALFHTRIYRLTTPTCGCHPSWLCNTYVPYPLGCLHSCSASHGLRITVGFTDFSLSFWMSAKSKPLSRSSRYSTSCGLCDYLFHLITYPYLRCPMWVTRVVGFFLY